MINSEPRTARQESIATVTKERLEKADTNATVVPKTAEIILPEEYKIKGNVIADKTAYGK